MARRRNNHGQRLAVGNLAERAVSKLVPPEKLRLVRVQIAWPEIARGRLARMTWPMHVKRGLLTIAVVDNQWLHELSYMRGEILQELAQRCPRAQIEDLRFRVGAIDALPLEPLPPKEPRPEGLPDEPSPDTLEALDEIEDPTLRQTIANARMALSHRLQR